ncbi:hypothetical protein [uncultured Rothia sp.]|uniref:hypothetical protein n=1 Tax=uncultured Rothia sp. TaxID=316088 RepID=UPI00288A3858|nr:hypothetical protein [uncultured Rothia sp.]
MSNIFSNLRWGILPLVLVTTTAMAMSTPASAMSTVNFSDSNLTHQEIKESLDNLIGINTITITRIMATGSPEAILAGVGYAGLRCIMGR